MRGSAIVYLRFNDPMFWMIDVRRPWPNEKSTMEILPTEEPPIIEPLNMLSANVDSVAWEVDPPKRLVLPPSMLDLKRPAEPAFSVVKPLRLSLGFWIWRRGRVCYWTGSILSHDIYFWSSGSALNGYSQEKSNSHFLATSLERLLKSFCMAASKSSICCAKAFSSLMLIIVLCENGLRSFDYWAVHSL